MCRPSPFERVGFTLMQLSDEQVKRFKEINQKAGVALGADDAIREVANGLANFLINSQRILLMKNKNNPLEQCPCGRCTMHDNL